MPETSLISDSQPQLSDPEQWLSAHGDALFRYAMAHVQDASHAEDLVQETLLAAMEGRNSYTGKSSERTWLVAILKHKMVDHARRRWREITVDDPDEKQAAALDAWAETMFDSRGEWTVPLQDWGKPEEVLDQKRFWEAFDRCLKRLPPKLALLFSLREIAGLSTEEICKDLEITTSNSWVMLYRARVGLKECLELQWLGSGGRDR